jgi:RNA recognition motif-containing protein
MDKVLERPRGTAFVQFAEKASAEKAIAAAASAMPAVRAKEKLMITVGGAEGGVMLDGRSLLISPAISKEKAKEIDKVSTRRSATGSCVHALTRASL